MYAIRSYYDHITIPQIRKAIQGSNNDVGGRLIEIAETEFMVRGLGYIKSKKDLETVVVGTDSHGTPILLRDLADIGIGPELRRGLSELVITSYSIHYTKLYEGFVWVRIPLINQPCGVFLTEIFSMPRTGAPFRVSHWEKNA